MTRPSYLGLLNAIAVAERQAEHYLAAWADTTTDTDVAAVLRFVALREGEHAQSFAERIEALGFDLREPKDTSPFDAQLKLASADIADVDKFERLGIGGPPTKSDPFDKMFFDKSIDIETGALLGRYIAEERDSGRRLEQCHLALTGSRPLETDDSTPSKPKKKKKAKHQAKKQTKKKTKKKTKSR